MGHRFRKITHLKRIPRPRQVVKKEFKMINLGLTGILLQALLAGSVNANDWMTMVQPVEYFKFHNVTPTIDRMIDFAIEDVDSAKGQIKQLAALRYLTEEADRFRKAKNYDTNRMAI